MKLTEEEYLILKELDEHGNFQLVNGIPAGDPALEENSRITDDGKFKISLGILMNYLGDEEEVTIPEEVNAIDEFAFDEECETVRRIYVPDTVETLSRCAFEGCPNLEEIRLPTTLTELPSCVFSDCANLNHVEIPASVKVVGECAFYNCSSLETITIPDSVEEMGDCVFFGCHSLREVNLPDSLTKIGQYAFKECESLAGEDGYVTVKNVLYDYFGNETRISIPSSIVRAEDDLYEDISDTLTYLYCEYRQIPGFPDDLKHLAARTFLTNKKDYTAEAAREWEQYIAGEKAEFLLELIEKDDAASMKGLMEFAEYSQEDVSRAIDGISKKSQTAIMAILLDYRNRKFHSKSVGLGRLNSLKL